MKILDTDFDQQNMYIETLRQMNKLNKYKAYVKTYGCQQNVADSEKIKGILHEIGYELINDVQNADLIIYNTCAIRENAEDRVFGNTGALKNLKKQKSNKTIALCGCMTQQEHIAQKIRESYPYVDLIMGTHSLHLLPELLYKVIVSKQKIVEINHRCGLLPENIPIYRSDSKKGLVPIMYGCDNFCTYCVVPYVRGREYSRKSSNIISEIQEMVNNGYNEITLLGHNVNSYGKGLSENVEFATLLQTINALDGDFKINFMTSHPKDFSKRLIDVISNCEKISSHLHLPVQSGSNRILKLMNRKYTIEEYKSLVDYAKDAIPDLVLSSDILVGFPGEMVDDFAMTKELIKYVKFDFLYTFIYSKREKTAAAKMEDNTPLEEKHRRLSELLDLQTSIHSNLK